MRTIKTISRFVVLLVILLVAAVLFAVGADALHLTTTAIPKQSVVDYQFAGAMLAASAALLFLFLSQGLKQR